MTQFNHPLKNTPGELYYRDLHQQLNIERFYREWRMNDIGLSTSDIDALISDFISTEMSYHESNYSQDFGQLEMKHWRASDNTIRGVIEYHHMPGRAANKAKIPTFIIRYYPVQEYKQWMNVVPWDPTQQWYFETYPGNEYAKLVQTTDRVLRDEAEYIQFLYQLQQQTISMDECRAIVKKNASALALTIEA